jgi:threonine synthase
LRSRSAQIAGAKLSAKGVIPNSATVVAILTSTGLKDPASSRRLLPDLPQVKPTLVSLKEAMRTAYGWDMVRSSTSG